MRIGQQIVRPAKQGVDRELDFVASLLVIFCLFGTSFLYQCFLLLVFFLCCWILVINEYGLCYCCLFCSFVGFFLSLNMDFVTVSKKKKRKKPNDHELGKP